RPPPAAVAWVAPHPHTGNADPNPVETKISPAAPSGTFSTSAGPLNIAANEQKQYEALCDIVGRPELKSDPRFAERQSRKDNRAALKKELEVALNARPAKEWEQLFNERGVPAGCVLSVSEILAEEQVRGRKFVERLKAEVTGGQAMHVTRPGFCLEQDFPEPSPPPQLGQDTKRWLGAVGYSAQDIAALGARGVVAFSNRPTVKETVKMPDLKVRAESSSS